MPTALRSNGSRPPPGPPAIRRSTPRARSRRDCPEIPTASPLANSRSIVINRIMVLDRGGFGMLVRDYFRGDQQAGVTAPDLTKECDFHDHIVHARGKNDQSHERISR